MQYGLARGDTAALCKINTSHLLNDGSLDLKSIIEADLHELAEPAGVVVANSTSISKGFQNNVCLNNLLFNPCLNT